MVKMVKIYNDEREKKKMLFEQTKRLIFGLSGHADQYDPRYDGKERYDGSISEQETENRAVHMLRNRKIIIGGSHTKPMQAFCLRECGAKLNPSGKSVTVEVKKMIEKFDKPDQYYFGTNRHNTITFIDAYIHCMAVQPWERR